jgi:L-alanine-DL-glutamate epimerase-like enolase superfamily enzyme
MHAWHDLAELRRRARVPIAGGELNAGWQEFQVMLEKGCFDIYQPDATFGGGISDAKKVQQACTERGLHFAPHTWSNGFSMVVNLHVHVSGAMDHPLEYPIEPPGWTPEYRDALLVEPVLADSNGTVAVPEGPGLGIEIDEDSLGRYGEKFFEITTKGIAVKTIREKGLFTALKLARKKKRRG